MGCLSLCTCCCCLMSYVHEGILSIYLRMYINKDPNFIFFTYWLTCISRKKGFLPNKCTLCRMIT